jgi:ribosomal protein S28E/S33
MVEMMKGRDVSRIMVRRVMKNLKLGEGGRYL